MDIFEDIELPWKGAKYLVPAEKVMGLVAVVEDEITIEELVGKGVKRVKLSRAFAAALRYAGAKKIDNDEVFISLFGESSALASTTGMIDVLLKMMIPPEHLRTKSNTNGEEKKPPTARKKPAQKRLRKRT